ncbi:DUF4150 domain-containing protein [Fulvimarina sp. MAC8]|uniref:DUF4150 domain-containing protein n=1 Tax=Fulvimarina sp. MAC8 TaxID=3162874 RepID=UPI0032EF3D35
MKETVAINGLTLCHKHSDGWVRSTMPDVCKAPDKPVPFTNVAFAKDLAKGTTTVFSHGGAMNGVKGSEFYKSIGDEPGVGGGVKSGVNLHRATFLSWSPNVFMEGRPVTRLTDKMLLNKGNTISAGGYFTGALTGASAATANFLCSLACDCKAEKQSCVDAAIKTMPKTPQNGYYSEVTFTPMGQMYRNDDHSPMTRMGVPGSRLDITRVVNGQPDEFVEMKFKGDRPRRGQLQRYGSIAASYDKTLQLITVEKDCQCSDNDHRTETQNVTVPQNEGMSLGAKVVIGGAVVLGTIAVIACVIVEPCGALGAGSAAAGGLGAAALAGAQ